VQVSRKAVILTDLGSGLSYLTLTFIIIEIPTYIPGPENCLIIKTGVYLKPNDSRF
jgi:hypothetical protein